jgi:TolB protein
MKISASLSGTVLAILVAFATPAHSGPGEVAFVSIRGGEPQIYLRDGYGRETPLTASKSGSMQPAWSPDGQLLAFTSVQEGLTKVFVMSVDGKSARRLTREDRVEFSPSWSPDGKSVAIFSMAPNVSGSQLKIVDVATGQTVSIAGNGLEKGPSAPTWSKDGKRIAFIGNDDKNNSQVWVADTDGTNARDVSSKFSSRRKAFAAISPDGRQVLYAADMRGAVDLILTDVQTLESRNLTKMDVAAMHESPQWSQDGQQILFASTRDDPELLRMDIFVMSADGSHMRNLSKHPHEDFDPRWSTSGRSVVFTSLRTGTSQLYEVDTVTTQTRRLTHNESHDMQHVLRPQTPDGVAPVARAVVIP